MVATGKLVVSNEKRQSTNQQRPTDCNFVFVQAKTLAPLTLVLLLPESAKSSHICFFIDSKISITHLHHSIAVSLYIDSFSSFASIATRPTQQQSIAKQPRVLFILVSCSFRKEESESHFTSLFLRHHHHQHWLFPNWIITTTLSRTSWTDYCLIKLT